MLVDDSPISAFYVDVNSADDHGRVGTTLDAVVDAFREDARAVGVGSYVWAVDADDNVCVALVSEAKGDWLQLHMDESTWQPLESVLPSTEAADPDRVSLHGVDPLDALRAMLRTPPAQG